MAEQKVWIGNFGPFIYDDADDLPGETPGTKPFAVRTDGRLRAGSAIDPGDVPTFDQVEALDPTILRESGVIDSLGSLETAKPLSANQGRLLNLGKEPADATILKRSDVINTLVSVLTDRPLSANQGRVLKELIDAIDVSAYVQKSGDTMTGDLTLTGLRVGANGLKGYECRGAFIDTDTYNIVRLKVVSAAAVIIKVNFVTRLSTITSNQSYVFDGGVIAIMPGGGGGATPQVRYEGGQSFQNCELNTVLSASTVLVQVKRLGGNLYADAIRYGYIEIIGQVYDIELNPT